MGEIQLLIFHLHRISLIVFIKIRTCINRSLAIIVKTMFFTKVKKIITE